MDFPCISCGSLNRIGAKFCRTCGKQLLLKGRYRMLALLGQGNFGTVYKTEDSLFHRFVAIKEMSMTNLASSETTKAVVDFQNEAQLLVKLEHKNLPRIYDFFGEGRYWYIVMDFIEGETLETYLNKMEDGMPVAEALSIGIQVATVLDYLHSFQFPIVFRDLNPANIMRTPTGDIYLIDFGIARHFYPGKLYTEALGKAGYAAPEQFRQQIPATLLSDVYGLGATLHHLLSGRHPLTNPQNFFDFPPLQSFMPSIPSDLNILIMRMLERDMDKRPRIIDVKKDLETITSRLTQVAGSQLTWVKGDQSEETEKKSWASAYQEMKERVRRRLAGEVLADE